MAFSIQVMECINWHSSSTVRVSAMSERPLIEEGSILTPWASMIPTHHFTVPRKTRLRNADDKVFSSRRWRGIGLEFLIAVSLQLWAPQIHPSIQMCASSHPGNTIQHKLGNYAPNPSSLIGTSWFNNTVLCHKGVYVLAFLLKS